MEDTTAITVDMVGAMVEVEGLVVGMEEAEAAVGEVMVVVVEEAAEDVRSEDGV